MPKVTRETAQFEDYGPVAEWHEFVEGYEISFITFREDIDGAPLLKGLPNDSCQCPHWGYVLKGRLTFRSADRVETFEAGDAFYVQPGHVPTVEAGTEYVQFSPAAEAKLTNAAIQENMQKLQHA